MDLLKIYSSLVLNKSEYDKGLEQAEAQATSSADKIAKSFTKMAKVVGVAFSVAKIIQFGKESMNVANQQIEVERKLETIMRQRMKATDQSIQSIKNYASQLQKVGVVGDEVTLAGAQQLATFLNTEDALKTLIPAMQNLAVQQNGVNVSAENLVSVGNMFGKVLQGQTSALSRVGITFTEAEEKALKYGNELQRAQTLAQVITNNVGNMNQVLAQTPEGRIARLKNNFGDLREQVGNGLLNVLSPAVQFLNAIVVRLQQGVAYLGAFMNALGKATGLSGGNSGTKKLATDLSNASGSIGKLSDGTSKVSNNLNKASKTASKLKRTLMGFDEITKLSDVESSDTATPTPTPSVSGVSVPVTPTINTSGLDLAGGAVDRLQKKFDKIKLPENLVKSIKNLKRNFDELAGTGGKGLSWLLDNVLKPLGKWTMNEALPRVINLFANGLKVLNSVLEALEPLGKWLWENFLQPLAKWTGDRILDFLDLLNTGLENLSKWIDNHQEAVQNMTIIFTSFFVAFKLVTFVSKAIPIITLFGTKISGLIGTVTTVISLIGEEGLIATVTGLVSPFGLAVGAIGAMIAVGVLLYKNWDKIKDFAGKLGEAVKQKWEGMKKATAEKFEAIKAIAKKKFDEARDSITAPIEKAKETIKNIIEKIKGFFKFKWSLPHLPLPHLDVEGRFSLMPPSVPKFKVNWYAKGGIVDSATLFGNNVIGESGREAIVPLENHTEWTGKVAQQIASMLGGQPINITVQSILDGKKVATNTVKYINDTAKRTGYNPLSAYI